MRTSAVWKSISCSGTNLFGSAAEGHTLGISDLVLAVHGNPVNRFFAMDG
jgi:hypothetical protein